MTKRTPLHATHEALGARMIDFGGWDMPVQYEGIVAEAKATRERVGLFDIGHMGRLEVVGPQHAEAVDWVVSSSIVPLATGRVKYGLLLTERGTAIDDVLVYRDVDRTHVVVNAGNRDADREHFRRQVAAKGFDATVHDAAAPDLGTANLFLGSAQHMLALQGPRSEDVLQRVVNSSTDLSQLRYYRMTRTTVISVPALVSRTGYTGEDGFEVFFPVAETERMWDLLMAQGEDLGLRPVGLGARDALRTEAGMPLYGNEIDLETTPLEANLHFGVQLDKDDFHGRDALLRQRAEGVRKTLVGMEVDTKRVPRHGCRLLAGGEEIGVVTSGTFGPTLGKNIAMGFVPPRLAEVGTQFDIDIRGKVHRCTVVPLPFYKRPR
jgi:aminomethyltransferase